MGDPPLEEALLMSRRAGIINVTALGHWEGVRLPKLAASPFLGVQEENPGQQLIHFLLLLRQKEKDPYLSKLEV